MNITETKITVKELCQDYHDNGDGGCVRLQWEAHR